MNMKAVPALASQGRDAVGSSILVSARLKKLRHERHLVERAIVALTEISRTRHSRNKRTSRN
jgi:hypothetical protein